MAKITKKSAFIKCILGFVFVIAGILCWFVFSKQTYPRTQYYTSGNAIYDKSGNMVRYIEKGAESVKTENGNIVVEIKYLRIGGIAFVGVGAIIIIISSVEYIPASKEDAK